ncbi:hypothetical protein [Micromonospora sp. 4G55]|uniref:hypothetical protein n=1 Tax=Micromonospora sp. 4G55 TaxID=2806102 RepID=UPI001A63E2A9|nr:hypothetical protein [Micromonospora sp. 4G55]MBM0257338.1 hypothetical protein [Micromonospora sp. 4G55]
MSDSGSAHDGAPAALAWLAHPVTLLGLAALVVNDHVLKAAFPGPVTGKVSDVAGLLLAPPLVAVLLALAAPRLPVRATVVVGLVTVGAGFTIVKISGYAAQLASGAWSALAGPSVVRADVTDLLALPALTLAWWSWTRARRRPVGRHAARLVRLVVLLPAAVLAVAATSAPDGTPEREAARVVVTDRGVVHAGEDRGIEDRVLRWWRSPDGVTGWTVAAVEEEQTRRITAAPGEPARSACVPAVPNRCYRLVAGRLAVQASDDAGRTWRTDWEVSDRDRDLLDRWERRRNVPRPRFEGRDLAVWDAPTGGHRVLVANAGDGFLLRHTDGRWERTGWPDGTAARPLGKDPNSGIELMRAVVVVPTLAGIVLIVAGASGGRRAGLGLWWPLALSGPAFLAGVALLPDLTAASTMADAGTGFPLSSLLAVAVAGIGAVAALATLWSLKVPVRWTIEVLAALLVTTVLVGAALYAWLTGESDADRSGMLAVLAAAVPGLLLARYAGRLVGRQAERPADPPWPAVPPVGPQG